MSVVDQLEQIFKDKYDDLVRIYKSRAGENDVEDMLQEGFYRALHYKDSFHPTFLGLETWLTAIFNNCLRDLLREKRDGAAMHDSEHEPTIDSRCPSDVEMEAKIVGEIKGKRGNTKNILWLYFVMGCKNEDIHKIVGGSYKNVDMATYNFRNEMRDKYGHLMRD